MFSRAGPPPPPESARKKAPTQSTLGFPPTRQTNSTAAVKTATSTGTSIPTPQPTFGPAASTLSRATEPLPARSSRPGGLATAFSAGSGFSDDDDDLDPFASPAASLPMFRSPFLGESSLNQSGNGVASGSGGHHSDILYPPVRLSPYRPAKSGRSAADAIDLDDDDDDDDEVLPSHPPSVTRPGPVSGTASLRRPAPAGPTPGYVPFLDSVSGASQQKRRRDVADTDDQPPRQIPDPTSLQVVPDTEKRGAEGYVMSKEQQYIISQVVNRRKSVFFTGAAGTGKSVLLRELIDKLWKKFFKGTEETTSAVAVTASTGLAACNIGGMTLHSFAGIGLGKDPVAQLIKRVRQTTKARNRWLEAQVLIIDEISMIDAELFDKLEEIARVIRKNEKPFGGIQLVVTGDFFQLPPVPDKPGGRDVRFAFESARWPVVLDHTIRLTHVFRQKDPLFSGMLNEMREGRMSAPTIQNFRVLDRPLGLGGGIAATELFPTRREVDTSNTVQMSKLPGQIVTFEANDGGTIEDPIQRNRMLDNFMAPRTLALKPDAQVMLIKNLDQKLVNGSVGTVRAFMTAEQWNEGIRAGFTGEHADIKPGMSAKGRPPPGIPRRELLEMGLDSWDHVLSTEVVPVVRFKSIDGSFRDILCSRETWTIELPTGEVQLYRSQVPLILAWALSIHKAQGQTLDFVRVDLGRVFEKGQAYVALSRATTMSGLQVLRFDPTKVMAHERVRDFYAGLAEHRGRGGSKRARV